MNDREAVIQRIESTGIIAILRTRSSEQLIDVVRALVDADLTCVEVTMTVPGALDVVRAATSTFGDRCAFGAGTILDAETARAAILAGAQYIVAPILDFDMIRLCRRYNVPVMPGTLTPTEMLRAHEAGADMIKVFPATSLGPGYLKDIRGPLPQLKLMPTGGVTADNVGDWIRAGAAAVGMGGALATPALVEKKDYAAIARRAADVLAAVKTARQGG
ncbi:MAG: bifunctional 4-hydroxy-2-oxoglutarate aldolase/2-dehydro-3-deoxy-phosphogluconate aldolase [Phycisphaerae bacterium]|nr:bifunctional 4-hydroxy-2-oxoglutarate aldolase/2-dehydro-3-deoxy-phosphogluconate aldolase [Phycisphaerae bacterium]